MKDNCKTYDVKKLCRRSDPNSKKPPNVEIGHTCPDASPSVLKRDLAELYKNRDQKGLEKAAETRGKDNCFDYQNKLSPQIGEPLYFWSTRFSGGWLKISEVASYYVHDDPDNHPDKLVIPEEFPREDLHNLKWPIEEMKKGDVLIASINSIYFAKLVDEA